MKIVPFPTGGDAGADPAVIAELEAALAGADGPGADAWRELRLDVRTLAPPIDPGFESALFERLTDSAQKEQQAAPGLRISAAPHSLRRWWAGHALGARLLATGGAGALTALLIALLIAGPFSAGSAPVKELFFPKSAGRTSAPTRAENAPATPQGDNAESSAAASAPTPTVSGPEAGAGASSGRVEQLAASLTLGTAAAEVQKLADGISRVVTAEGGYVASSQVQVEKAGTSNATLNLSVPSDRLARVLSALGRLGSVRAESQSQQDITDSYGAAKRALGDAVAERTALLRALAGATTQAEIESLHRRLALAGGEIERARAAFARISRTASNANVEVTVLGEAHSANSGLTLHNGLHDAGRVLTVALVVLLIGLAALIPLLAVALALGLAARALRRGARERALRGG
jgi:Domain of unknown function (DUF4349)